MGFKLVVHALVVALICAVSGVIARPVPIVPDDVDGRRLQSGQPANGAALRSLLRSDSTTSSNPRTFDAKKFREALAGLGPKRQRDAISERARRLPCAACIRRIIPRKG